MGYWSMNQPAGFADPDTLVDLSQLLGLHFISRTAGSLDGLTNMLAPVAVCRRDECAWIMCLSQPTDWPRFVPKVTNTLLSKKRIAHRAS